MDTLFSCTTARRWSGGEPHAVAGVVAPGGRMGVSRRVDRFVAQRRGRSFRGGDAFGGAVEVLEIGHGLVFSHYAPTLFLRFIDATSSSSGFWPACGWSLQAKMRRLRICWRPSGPRGIMRSTAF